MKKHRKFIIAVLLVITMLIPSMSSFAIENENIEYLDYVIYREDGTVRETGTMPNGTPKERYSFGSITLNNYETMLYKPAGTSGLYALSGTRMEFAFTLNRKALVGYGMRNSNNTNISSSTNSVYGSTLSIIAPASDWYYGFVTNYSSDSITINSARLDW